MEDLTADQVIGIHQRVAAGRQLDRRIVSEAGLHQLVFRANLVDDCIPRAALVFYTLCAYPPFREANEATAVTLSADILASGGYRVTGDPAGLMDLADGIGAFTAEQEDIERWFRENTNEEGNRRTGRESPVL